MQESRLWRDEARGHLFESRPPAAEGEPAAWAGTFPAPAAQGPIARAGPGWLSASLRARGAREPWVSRLTPPLASMTPALRSPATRDNGPRATHRTPHAAASQCNYSIQFEVPRVRSTRI